MAFVNKQSGDRAEQDQGASGQLVDFDPNDPDVVKVHYDLAAWNFDQRAQLSETLAESDVPHVWDGEELVVPETVEDDVDAMFEQFEAAFGPFPIVLAADDEATEFGLDEWTDVDREVLTEALIDAEVPHRWEGTTVVVAADAEDAVDDLLDAIEAGELVSAVDEATPAPEGALSTMFLAADRLAKDPLDRTGRSELIDLLPQLEPKQPPYGLAHRVWIDAIGRVAGIVDLIDAESAPDADDEAVQSTIIGAAQELRSRLRQYV